MILILILIALIRGVVPTNITYHLQTKVFRSGLGREDLSADLWRPG